MSGFAIMVDKVDADPVTIHKDSCTYYTDRKPDATTTVWCQVDTLEDAEELARRLERSYGAKRADCCLDGRYVIKILKSFKDFDFCFGCKWWNDLITRHQF